MTSLWQPETRQTLEARVARLTPDRRPLWGRMSAPQMVVHLVDGMRMAIGDLKVASKNTPLRFSPLKQLIIYCLPFPKGAPTAPELLARQPAEWATDVGELVTLLHIFGTREIDGPWPDHPAFGRLSGRAWGILAYRHCDHHLRQFGA